jgi:hypothetical protein
VDQEGFERNPPKNFAGLAASFRFEMCYHYGIIMYPFKRNVI